MMLVVVVALVVLVVCGALRMVYVEPFDKDGELVNAVVRKAAKASSIEEMRALVDKAAKMVKDRSGDARAAARNARKNLSAAAAILARADGTDAKALEQAQKEINGIGNLRMAWYPMWVMTIHVSVYLVGAFVVWAVWRLPS